MAVPSAPRPERRRGVAVLLAPWPIVVINVEHRAVVIAVVADVAVPTSAQRTSHAMCGYRTKRRSYSSAGVSGAASSSPPRDGPQGEGPPLSPVPASPHGTSPAAVRRRPASRAGAGGARNEDGARGDAVDARLLRRRILVGRRGALRGRAGVPEGGGATAIRETIRETRRETSRETRQETIRETSQETRQETHRETRRGTRRETRWETRWAPTPATTSRTTSTR